MTWFLCTWFKRVNVYFIYVQSYFQFVFFFFVDSSNYFAASAFQLDRG